MLYQLLPAGGMSYAGPVVNEETALRATAVYACIRIISESIAALPLVLYEQSGRIKNRATAHPLYQVLHSLANPEMTSMEWREHAFAHAAAWGNHWSEIEFDAGGQAIALWPLRPDRMEGWERREGQIWWLYRLPNNTIRPIPAWRLHHIRTLGDGVMGYSPIRLAARQAIGLSLATEEFGARFFANGARPGLLIRHPGKLSEPAYRRLQADWAQAHQGLTNAHRTRILEEGMDIVTVGIPPNEAQFLETRKFQTLEIARVYRVPPHMLADLDRATFGNIEHQSLEFVMHTLMPWLVRHEQAIQRDLLSEQTRGRYYAKYLVDGLLRGDTASRYQAYNMAIMSGIMTRNEAREKEDLNPLTGLDEPLVPLNMLEVGQDRPTPPAETPRHAHPELTVRAEVSETEAWDARSIRAATNRQAVMNRTVRLWQDAAERMVKREVADVRRAVDRTVGKRNTDQLLEWLAGFYEEMRGWAPDYYRALMQTYAETILADVAGELGDDPPRLDDDLRQWIETYLANFLAVYTVGSERQLRALIAEAEDEEDAAARIHARLDGWQETRPGKTAHEQAFEAGNALSIFGYVAAGVQFLRWSARGDSCPICKQLDGRRIPINGAFVSAGDTVEAEGVAPLPIKREMKHGPIHGGCDCVVVRG